MATLPQSHADLMDNVYRGQRHIYDATRKYFLFGRDRLIAGLDLAPGETLLEVGCGTGRNLDLAGQRWPGARLHGLDISSEMLRSAQARLGSKAVLVQGDACGFTPALFGQSGFNRVMISFALSMIPDWEMALARAYSAVAPGGALHIVDFGDGAGLPGLARKALWAWLAHFHVTPRLELPQKAGGQMSRGPLGYYQMLVVKKEG